LLSAPEISQVDDEVVYRLLQRIPVVHRIEGNELGVQRHSLTVGGKSRVKVA